MRNELQIQVGLRIKALRELHGVSQEQFAHRIGMDRSYLASIEVGSRNVTLLNLDKIATGFGLSLSEFFEGISTPTKPDDPISSSCSAPAIDYVVIHKANN